jgi:predicted Fe-S protein YdhL (DUF1289 family)
MIASPCIDVCRMNETHGVCAGCFRTLDEIARWPEMSDAERARLIEALGERRRVMGELVTMVRIPPT